MCRFFIDFFQMKGYNGQAQAIPALNGCPLSCVLCIAVFGNPTLPDFSWYNVHGITLHHRKASAGCAPQICPTEQCSVIQTAGIFMV